MIEYFKCEECGKLCNIKDKVEALEHELVWRNKGEVIPSGAMVVEDKRLVHETFLNFLCPECADKVRG